MGLYLNNNSVLQPLAGRGKAEFGSTTSRTGTVLIGDVEPSASNSVSVTFDTPLGSTNYHVIFAATDGNSDVLNYCLRADTKTVNGFQFAYSNLTSTKRVGCSVQYTAYELYSDIDYDNILASMPSDASSSNKLLAANSITNSITNGSQRAITSGAIYTKLGNTNISSLGTGTITDAIATVNSNLGKFPSGKGYVDGYLPIQGSRNHNSTPCAYIIEQIRAMSNYTTALQYNSSGTEWTYIFSKGTYLGSCLRMSHTGTIQYYFGNWTGAHTTTPPYDLQYWKVETITTGAATTPSA